MGQSTKSGMYAGIVMILASSFLTASLGMAADCRFGVGSLRLDGDDDFATLPLSSLNAMPQGTIEMWLKFADLSSPSATPGQQWIFTRSKHEGTHRNDLTIGKRQSGLVHRYFVRLGENTAELASIATIAVDVWTHIAMSWDGQFIRLYINGAIDDSMSADRLLIDDPAQIVRMGMISAENPAEEAHFDGTIDELRISNVPLAPSEFCLTGECTPDIHTTALLHLNMNAEDASSNNHDAVLNNGATFWNCPPPPNLPPVAACNDMTLAAYCAWNEVSVDAGSYDPDGGQVTVRQEPPAPYPVGQTLVSLIVTDDGGLEDTCTATISIDWNPALPCSIRAEDVDGNEVIDIIDVVKVIGTAFRNVAPTTNTCDLRSTP